MKILLQNSLFYPQVIGGAEVFTQLLAERLAQRGWAVDALATTGRRSGPAELATRPLASTGGLVYEAPASGLYDLLPTEGVTSRPGLLTRGLHHFAAVHSPRWLQLAGLALDKSAPDLLHTNTIVGMTPVVWRAARERGIPIVHTLHDYHLLCPRTTLLRSDRTDCLDPPLPCRLLARLKLTRTAGVQVVTAPSRFVLDRHVQAGAFCGARTEVVPNACAELPDEIPDRSRQATLRGLFLGQLDSHKGVAELMTALNGLFALSAYADVGFDFAGQGPLAAAVEAFCARHPDRARYHGFVTGEAKRTLLREAAWLVQPAVWAEVFGLTLLEACSWGLPVIATRRGGIPEVIRDQREGLLVEPKAEDLLLAMQYYHDDPELRLEHGRTARRRAADFTLERQVDRLEAIYRSVLEAQE